MTRSHSSLLKSFDAAREFIRAMWERTGERCNDLAQLLGSMNRSESDGPPLDIAQWTDWLDAAISVRPDLADVKIARHQMQEDYKEFVRICAVKDSELQREMMAHYRAKRLGQSWHRAGEEVISTVDAYKIMLRFVQAYGERGGEYPACLAEALKDLEQANDLRRATGWSDWLRALSTVQGASYPLH